MKAAGTDTELRLLTSAGPAAVRAAPLVSKEMLEAAGFTIDARDRDRGAT